MQIISWWEIRFEGGIQPGKMSASLLSSNETFRAGNHALAEVYVLDIPSSRITDPIIVSQCFY